MTEKLVSFQRRLAGLDLELPPKMAGLLATWQAVRTVGADDPLADLRTKIAAGDLDAKDATKLVKAAVGAYTEKQQGQAIANNLASAFQAAERAVLTGPAIDEIIVTLRPTFDAAVATIGECVPFLGEKPDRKHLAGPEAFTLFGRWEHAVRQLSKVTQLRRQVGGWGYAGNLKPDVVAYLADAATVTELDHAQDVWRGEGDGFTRLVAAGIAVRLNTAAQSRAIVARVTAKADAEAAEVRERQAEIARAHGRAEADAWRTGTIIPPETRRVRPV